jgi:hypothetical protein
MKQTTRFASRALIALVMLWPAAPASAQESKSAPLAKQLVAALDAGKMDSIAARDPSKPDLFVAALYFPGLQLLVVSARYAAPQLLDDRIGRKEFRDIYIDLNSASVPDTKVFIEDAACDGLHVKRSDNNAFDAIDSGGKRTQFDGDWKKQKLSEQDYMKAFSAADEQYAQTLTALLAQLKKTS